MKIRKATIKDFDQLLKLLVGAEKSEAEFDKDMRPSEVSREGLKKQIKRVLKEKRMVYFVAEKEGKLVGVILMNNDEYAPEIGWIGEFFVEKNFRRQGVGAKLMETGINWLREQGKSIVRLAVHRQNKRAWNFYEKLAFSEAERKYFTLEKEIK